MSETATQTPIQDRLVPDEPPSSAVEMVPVDAIDFEDIGPAPEPVLEALMVAQGILTPLTLARKQDGRCELIAGRRRLPGRGRDRRSGRSAAG